MAMVKNTSVVLIGYLALQALISPAGKAFASPGALPGQVLLRNNQDDFTGNFFYSLNREDQRIYIKPRQPGQSSYLVDGELKELPAEKGGWVLHDRTGGPGLPAGRKIKEISVACEILVAVDDQDRVYLYQPTYKELPTLWQDTLGPVEQFPFLEKLMLPADRRAWSFSCSTRVNPEVRRTSEFMHADDIIEYSEDIEGKKIEFGLTATIYSLSADGRLIHYWDTGLAPSFSRAFMSPQRGAFVIETMSTAGSTVFVSGRESDGTHALYTRMYDYEMNGACPGQRFSFDPTPQRGSTEVLGIMTAWRRLPLEGWGKVALPVLQGAGVITERISIHTTGKGNGARELRIEGLDARGTSGYYFKSLDAAEWRFFETGLPLIGAPYGQLPALIEQPAQKDLTNNFSGELRLGAGSRYAVELRGFHHYQSIEEPALLRVYLSADKSADNAVDFDFHTVDSWTAFAQKSTAERFIGTDEGEAKLLIGSLRIPATTVLPTAAQHKNLVAAVRALHAEMHTLEVRATTSEVAISSHLIIREFAGPFSYKAMPDFRAAVKNHAEARGNPYLELANEPSLCAGPFASAAELNEKLGLNHQRLAYMKSLPASFRAEHRKHSLLYFLVFILLKIVNPFVNLLGLEHKMPELGAVSKTQSFLAYPHLRENLARTFTREPKSYQRALALVERRIAEYEQRLSVIASSATE